MKGEGKCERRKNKKQHPNENVTFLHNITDHVIIIYVFSIHPWISVQKSITMSCKLMNHWTSVNKNNFIHFFIVIISFFVFVHQPFRLVVYDSRLSLWAPIPFRVTFIYCFPLFVFLFVYSFPALSFFARCVWYYFILAAIL